MPQKPELLLPVGNTESFFAALQAGADAVYLGLSKFNARVRASNFNQNQFISILKEAKKRNVLVYVTLNTVIKNSEIGELINYLHFLQDAETDGIIIQDWGVYHLAKNYFPKLKIHASTQMGIHNSQGMQHLSEKKFVRAVLARELTLKELDQIVKKSPIETEVFVHGSLCYSFSGMCLFSSYTGGRGANRGICAQPCRRKYSDEAKTKFLFNMKDNQLLEYIPRLGEMGVASLKVEGRMKNAEYVFRVGSAYRLAIDGNSQYDKALKMLQWDFGRPKTAWFAGNDIKLAIAHESDTGIFVGKVETVVGSRFYIQTDLPLDIKYRLRIVEETNPEPIYIVVQHVVKERNGFWIDGGNKSIKTENKVYITKMQDQKFRDNLEKLYNLQLKPINEGFKNTILKSLTYNTIESKQKLYFRIGSPEWMKLINFNELDGLFLMFSKSKWLKLDFTDGFFQQNLDKIFIELPRFIAEGSIPFYTHLIEMMVKSGIQNFVIGQVSQKLMIPEGCRIITNENVYVFNDSAAKYIQNEGLENFVYPFEIDFETLESMQNKNGIVPLYFYPELFYSRMPVDLESGGTFSGDDEKTKYRRFRKNGLTIVVPDQAVSILQHKNRLAQKGFTNFLIDVSYDILSKNRLKTLKTRFIKSEQIQPTTTFNFTKGLV